MERRPDWRAFLPEIIHPFPIDAFRAWRAGPVHGAVLELSYQGQLRRYLLGLTDLQNFRSASRSGGAPLTWPELTRILGVIP